MDSIYVIETPDLNNHYFNDINLYSEQNGSAKALIVSIITFFSYGLKFGLLYYITRFTKTIYTSSFFDFFKMILDLFYFAPFVFTFYFEKSLTYSAIASMSGFVGAYFISDDFESNTICELRELNVEKEELKI